MTYRNNRGHIAKYKTLFNAEIIQLKGNIKVHNYGTKQFIRLLERNHGWGESIYSLSYFIIDHFRHKRSSIASLVAVIISFTYYSPINTRYLTIYLNELTASD